MRLVINEYGSTINREQNRFIVKNRLKDQREEFSADHVNQILISSGASISSSVIKLAMENNIDILYLNKYGTPYARIYPCKLGGTTLTRKRQAESNLTIKGFVLAKSMIEGKIRNQLSLLKSLAKDRESERLQKAVGDMERLLPKLRYLNANSVDEIRNQLLGIEGMLASYYFSALSTILPMKGRDRESKDPVNIMLNYGYGILYSEVEKACIIAGLDPYLGYLHTDRYGKPSMVLDLMEEFRSPVVDRAIVTLFSRKLVTDSDFVKNGDTKVLSDSGRKKVIEAIMKRLCTEVRYRKKKLKIQAIILEQSRLVVRYLLEDHEYKPYIHGW